MPLKNEFPVGVCQTCRKFPLMQINNVPTCPSCSTLEQPGSGLVNDVQDPGKEAMGKVMTEALNLPEFVVLPSKPFVKPPLNAAGQPTTNEKTPFVVQPQTDPKQGSLSLLDPLYSFLCNRPIKDLKEAKNLLKLKKRVLDLKRDLQLFLEGGNN